MPVPDQDQVRAILAEFEARLRDVVDRAWREWLDFPLRGRFVFAQRAQAVIVFDFIARLALAEFDGDSNVRVEAKKQTVHFLFRDQVILRFKKGNSKGVGSNIDTQAVLNFIDPQGVIPTRSGPRPPSSALSSSWAGASGPPETPLPQRDGSSPDPASA